MLNEPLCPDKNYLLDVLSDLIAFKTVAPPGSSYTEVIDYLVSIFRSMGFRTEKIVMPKEVFEAKCQDAKLTGDRVNLRASLDVGAKESLIIYTHVDVVPAGDNWSTDPFQMVLRDGKAYGRGVSDSKGAVAGLIAALQVLLKEDKPRYNLSILLTTDEEVGGYSGLCFFADQDLIKGDYMLCMDGFSDDLVIGSNGLLTWEVVVHGKSAHSGSSFLGVNALEKSIQVMEALMSLKKEVQSRHSTLSASSSFEAMGIKSLMPILNITMINAGIKENIVPDRCVLRGDRRVIPEETMEGAMAEIEKTVKALDLDLDLKFFTGYPPMRMNPDHHWISKVRAAIEEVTGTVPKLSGTQGSLDQAYATDKTRIPTCVYGVGRQMESNVHAGDENVRVDDLMNFARFLLALMGRR